MSFNSNLSSLSHLDTKGKIKVHTNSLDNFISENKITSIDVLKIDVEGFEHLVLIGGKRALTVTKYLLIEVTMENNPNYTFSSLMSLLSEKTYNFQLVGFRNYADNGLGVVPVMDCLMKNVQFSTKASRI